MDEEDLELLCSEMALVGLAPAWTDDFRARDQRLRDELGEPLGVTSITCMH
jgi:hypothetical protein